MPKIPSFIPSCFLHKQKQKESISSDEENKIQKCAQTFLNSGQTNHSIVKLPEPQFQKLSFSQQEQNNKPSTSQEQCNIEVPEGLDSNKEEFKKNHKSLHPEKVNETERDLLSNHNSSFSHEQTPVQVLLKAAEKNEDLQQTEKIDETPSLSFEEIYEECMEMMKSFDSNTEEPEKNRKNLRPETTDETEKDLFPKHYSLDSHKNLAQSETIDEEPLQENLSYLNDCFSDLKQDVEQPEIINQALKIEHIIQQQNTLFLFAQTDHIESSKIQKRDDINNHSSQENNTQELNAKLARRLLLNEQMEKQSIDEEPLKESLSGSNSCSSDLKQDVEQPEIINQALKIERIIKPQNTTLQTDHVQSSKIQKRDDINNHSSQENNMQEELNAKLARRLLLNEQMEKQSIDEEPLKESLSGSNSCSSVLKQDIEKIERIIKPQNTTLQTDHMQSSKIQKAGDINHSSQKNNTQEELNAKLARRLLLNEQMEKKSIDEEPLKYN